tara:strand:+ start:541 stop:1257 length:717 start_codon:yes stop_codon:yes gene_type:complete
MKNLRYIYKTNNTVHVLNAKISQNSKIGIGYILQTYHFSIDQIKNNDIKQDTNSCLDCPLSYNKNNGKSGGCYTHKGMQLMGLKSMIRSLNRNIDTINDFNYNEFNSFIELIKKTHAIDLVRFGAYGEPILLSLDVVKVLSSLSKKTTGYTHQWNKDKYNAYNNFFMASTHTEQQRSNAKLLGFRSFFVASDITKLNSVNVVNCPASKESSKNLTCIACGLCNGAKTNIKKDVYIMKH